MAIDLSAAFDMVDHGILIGVLDIAFNVGGKSLDWFKSCLSSRSCKVNIGESFSSNHDLCFSVPESSLCGPVLYNAYSSALNTVVPPAIAIHAYTYHGGTPRKAYCKAAAFSEYGCKSCFKKRQVHQFKRQSPDPTLAAHQESDHF